MTADITTLTNSIKNSHKLLGEIFVERALLTDASIRRLVEHARIKNIRLGELLEVIGLVTPQELAEALAIQYRCRMIIDFAKYTFSEQVLRLVPMDIAVKNTVFPLKLDDGKLGLAVADPTTQELYDALAKMHNVKVILYVSTRTEINKAIARHYLGQNVSEQSNAKTILVVEDNELTRESVERILKKHGCVVATAVDGMDAFTKIFTLKPKLVITDKVMPKLGGYEFLYAIRNIPEFRYMPVILMTAAATPDEEKEALERGFFDFILKPVKEIGLMTRVQRALQSSEHLYGKTG